MSWPVLAGVRTPRFTLRYGAALLAVLVAALVRWALQPVLGVAPPYITFYMAIVVAAAIGGFGPGLFATLLGGLLRVGLATLPMEKLQLSTVAEQVRLTTYLLSGFGISLIAGAMHRARQRVREEAAELRRISEELRQANEHLLEADRSKDRFLAVLSHELRNPLMPIQHSLYVLDQAAEDQEQVRRARQTINRQANQLARLVNDLLDVTRITRDQLTLQRERLDLREVVSLTLEDYRAIFAMRGVRLTSRRPERPVWIYGDAIRLSQVFGNLLHNAAKFAKDHGEVDVNLDQQGGQAILRVCDNGAGIPPKLLTRIFEPFAQAEQKLDRGIGGLGLGLTLVKRLVELHGGSVEAQSAGEGKGAQFTIKLPVETQLVAELHPEPRPAGRTRRRVLVIEDNVDSADTLSLLLKVNGHEVDVGYSGTEGIEKARSFNPDTVLCDIGLPGMDGYEVARAFRGDPALNRTMLVALTGYASREDREKALAAGFDRHLVKPTSVEELERVLNESGVR